MLLELYHWNINLIYFFQVLQKQKTTIELDIFSEHEFNDILLNLKRFKEQCDEPNLLSVSNEAQQKLKFSKSVYHKASRPAPRTPNLRKYRSFESFEAITDTPSAHLTHPHLKNADEMNANLSKGTDDPSSHQPIVEGESLSCSDLRETEVNSTNLRLTHKISQSRKPSTPGHYVLKRKSRRRESRDNLLEKASHSMSIREKLCATKEQPVAVGSFVWTNYNNFANGII